MSRKKHTGRAYIFLAAIFISMAVILVLVLSHLEPAGTRQTRPHASSVRRPPARPSASPERQTRKPPQAAPKTSSPTPPGASPEPPSETPRDSLPGEPAEGLRRPPRIPPHQVRIALIIDDVGYDSGNIDEYTRIRDKLTFSVLPFLENSKADARVLHEAGFEILIHMPMEPANYPSVNPGPNALLLGEPKHVIERKVLSMIEENPYAVGANNHMGSRATQDCDLMGWTIDVLKEKDLFFVDSLTTGASCAYELALENGLPAVRRDVFLDNTDSVESITDQFGRLMRIALSSGTAVGIGHIGKKHTLEVLKREIPLLERDGIALVFASEAVSRRH
jgi:uncharacterized protein